MSSEDYAQEDIREIHDEVMGLYMLSSSDGVEADDLLDGLRVVRAKAAAAIRRIRHQDDLEEGVLA